MGTFVTVYLDHEIRWADGPELVLSRLSRCLPACASISEYWRDSGSTQAHLSSWEFRGVELVEGREQWRFAGPGSLHLSVRGGLARLHAGARWRGFLSIPALHAPHCQAFRQIGLSLGARRLLLTSDLCDPALDPFIEGGNLDECAASLRAGLGDPQPSLDTISDAVLKQVPEGVPAVWFDDALQIAGR